MAEIRDRVIEYRGTLTAVHAYGTTGSSLRARKLGPGNGVEVGVHEPPSGSGRSHRASFPITLRPEVVRQFAHDLLEMMEGE